MRAKVALAYPAFEQSFKTYIPEIKVLSIPADVTDYDLVVFPGGEDVNPGMYGQRNTYSYFNERRDDFESDVFQHALNANIKMFGVCRGHQFIHVKHGGSLYQDLKLTAGIGHAGPHTLTYVKRHPIMNFFPDDVNSLHHQGVRSLHSRASIIATAGEVPEILSYTYRDKEYALTVQFHPEFMSGSENFFNWLTTDWLGIKENGESVEPKEKKKMPKEFIYTFTTKT